MKKSKAAPSPKPPALASWEQSRWFAPVAFALILVALLVLFGPFLFSDKMLYGSDTIQAGVFFRSLLVDYFREHLSVPQWNPYIFCGMPYVEAFHGDIFYPLSSLKYLGSLYRMLGLNLVIHIFLAGIFMYLAGRRFGLARSSALLSGACYMFAPYLVSLVAPGHDGKIFVTTLFPLVMLFLEAGFQTDGLRSFFRFTMLGLVLGVIILSPHPQMSYYTLWAVAFYAVFKLIVAYVKDRRVVRLIRPAVLTAYAVLLGLLISAIQFYPGYIYTTHYSPRADAKSGWDWATSWSMHQEEAMGLIIPEFPGVSSRTAETHYWGKNVFKDNSEAVGAVTLFVALFGALFARRREGYFFVGLAVFALVYALGATTPIFAAFYHLLPKVKSLRAPSMIMFLFSFSAALLAGMGMQALRERARELARSRGLGYLLLGGPALLLLLAALFSLNGPGMLSAWSSIFYSTASDEMVQQGISKLDVAFANLPAIQSGAWMAFVMVGLCALLLWLFRIGKVGASVLVLVVLLPVVDGVRFNGRFVDTVDPDLYFAPNPVSEYLAFEAGHSRVMNLGGVAEDMLPLHGVSVVTGYHGNQLRWFDELLGGPGARNKINPHLLNLAGARFLVMSSGVQVPERYFGEQPLREAASYGGARIMENPNALPRTYLVSQYRIVPDRKDVYPVILDGAEDFRKVVYLEREPELPVLADTSGDLAAIGTAEILAYAIDSVLVRTECPDNRLLVLTDNYYHAWQVTVDGQPAELLRAYGTFRAVAVPGGVHTVLFKYRSATYATGRLVTLLSLLYVAAVATAYGIHRRRSGSTDTRQAS